MKAFMNYKTDNSGEAFTFFSLLYLALFSFLYTAIYHDFRGFVFVCLLLAVIHAPSFLILFFTHHYQLREKFHLSDIVYLGISILLFWGSFILYQYYAYDERNLFPIFNEGTYIIGLLGSAAHIIVYSLLYGIYELIHYKRASKK